MPKLQTLFGPDQRANTYPKGFRRRYTEPVVWTKG
jgi:hypothetical protein